MHDEPTDPPMEPLHGTSTWYESGPELITDDLELASLIVRIGMASNALNAQFQAAADAGRHFHAGRIRTIISCLAAASALTNEAMRLTRENMKTLRGLVGQWPHARKGLLDDLGKLCSGKHPANQTLKRARNQLVFHWDAEVIKTSVHEYEKNEKIVWLEADGQSPPVHRLASDVLAHALFEGQESQQAIENATDRIGQAVDLMTEFFSACLFGYMYSKNVVRRTRKHNTLNGEEEPEDGGTGRSSQEKRMLVPKADWERKIFTEFAAALPLQVDADSIESRKPPEPDIRFW